MKKIINKYWPFLLIFGLSFLVTWPLLRQGYFSHQDDLQVIRIFEMRKCLTDSQIPCRWAPDMGWGNGIPLFNFYGVFTYYTGAIFSFIIGFIGASKALFFISLVAGSFGMYLLTKEFWGKIAGTTSGLLYLFAPYKALDVYVRGALAESLALAIAPFVFYFGYKLITSKKKNNYHPSFTFSLFALLITHNIMILIFLPVLAAWLFYWLYINKWKNLKPLLISLAFAFGFSAFFILPAFFEKGLIQNESLTRFELDFRANYLRLNQLFFDKAWGYGTSIPGPEGGMNFQIGWPYWWLAFISLPLIFILKLKKNIKVLVLSIFLTFLLSILMTHNKSTPIWVNIPLLKYFQFPWRFLSLSIFTSSILGGFVVSAAKNKRRVWLFIGITLLTVAFNWRYFRPKEFYNISDSEKLSGELWDEQAKGALLDYLPKTALEPFEAAPTEPIVRSGNAQISSFINNSNSWEFSINVETQSEIEVPVFYFPNWQVYVDGAKYPFSYDNALGRISLNLSRGNYQVTGKFENTTLRTVANLITLISIVGFVGYQLYAQNKKNSG